MTRRRVLVLIADVAAPLRLQLTLWDYKVKAVEDVASTGRAVDGVLICAASPERVRTHMAWALALWPAVRLIVQGPFTPAEVRSIEAVGAHAVLPEAVQGVALKQTLEHVLQRKPGPAARRAVPMAPLAVAMEEVR